MLKIKAGSVNRLKKELGLYVEEKERERKTVARMKEEGADTYDIKHAVRSPDTPGTCACFLHQTDTQSSTCAIANLCWATARASTPNHTQPSPPCQLCRRTSLRSQR